ncbi:AAA family ATPase [uncultured Psychrobacter sp.]|uniref:AAA family ATPase n=1 Tax=uncultured Psychrobacter sp. TaxID=259303 RepID=UPI00345B35EA
MSQSLTDIAKELKKSNKKVQLIYAFNGTGKTRLSREFRNLIVSEPINENGEEQTELARIKILYYNAFTEDLFYWDNNLEPTLKIQPNTFTDWILRDRGQDQNIKTNFQHYTNDKLNPNFIEQTKQITQNGRRVNLSTYPEVNFTYDDGADRSKPVKISKGEESNFVWSIFFTLLEEVIGILKELNTSKRDDDYFNELEYVFIDDPVSSLDDSHLIELAVDIAYLIKSNKTDLKFIITTHSPLFFNVLYNEFSNDFYHYKLDGTKKQTYKRGQSEKYRLEKNTDNTFQLHNSNDHPFSYHLFLLLELDKAIKAKDIKKYHFSFLRNILEKTSTYLGYKRWEDLLKKTADGSPDPFASRIMNLSSHSAHAGEEISHIEEKDKEKLEDLVKYLVETYGFNKQEVQNG